jgi:hypothetical protein
MLIKTLKLVKFNKLLESVLIGFVTLSCKKEKIILRFIKNNLKCKIFIHFSYLEVVKFVY